MSILYGSSEILVQSQTIDIPVNFLARIRGAEVLSKVASQIAPTLTGRDRAGFISSSLSNVCFGIFQYLRVRHGTLLIYPKSQATCRKLTTIPAVRHPVGQLFFNGHSIKDMILLKNGSYSFGFNLFGRKMIGLDIAFTLKNLAGELLLSKQIKLDPGGIAIDDYSVDLDGNETITGYVILLPQDTDFVRNCKNYETKFLLELKNSTTKKYFLEEGALVFRGL